MAAARRRLAARADPASPAGAAGAAGAAPDGAGGIPTTATGLLGAVAAQASFLVAIMYFLGALYLTAYYQYFRLDAFSLGFGFAELSMQSLNLVKPPLAVALALVVLAASRLAAGDEFAGRNRATALIDRVLRGVARAHPLIVSAGLVLLLLWRRIDPYEWTAPLLLGVGLLLGRFPGARAAPAPGGLWSRALPAFVACLSLMWAASLATTRLGEQEARTAADHVLRRTAVVVLSTERLSLAGPGVVVEDLGEDAHYRYRYSGLRRLIERSGRYYLLPVGWTARTGSTYVLQDSGDVRVELMPGTQRPRG